MESLEGVAAQITLLSGTRCASAPAQRVAGGSINHCYRWPAGGGSLFVKVAARESLAAFEAEAAGLAALEHTRALRVPRVLAVGDTADSAFLALEWLESRPADANAERRLGAGLAALHAQTAPRFGWQRDNTIGRTPQRNDWSDDWTEFFREHRLRPQLLLAAHNGLAERHAERGERLLESLPVLLAGHRPAASLLHGDLWGGNWLTDSDGEPVIFDPAVYYGDREADVAMTRLFGGFGAAFYRSYETLTPLTAGAALRAELYNLYHVLNHANLFGGGYMRQAAAMIDRLLAQVAG
jgi:protein-ribulosamine 3-kinase